MTEALAVAAVDPRAQYLADFASLEEEFYASEPAWLRALRQRALDRFREVGFPSLKEELWRHTSVAPIARQRFLPAARLEGDGVSPDRVRPARFSQFEGSELVFVNGHYAARLSTLKDLPPGVRVGSLAKMLAWDAKAVEPFLGRYAKVDANPFVALNTAFLQDGAFVDVPRGAAVEPPIHLLFVSTFHPAPVVSYPRNLIIVGEGAHATITESYVGLDEGVYFTNPVTEAVVGPAGRLDHYKLQRESEKAFHVGALQVHQERNSVVADNSLSFGGALVRNDVKCKHGSTTGQLDEAAIFYLRSRGIDTEAARAMLTYAFVREVVDPVKVAAMHAVLSIQLASRLPYADVAREAL